MRGIKKHILTLILPFSFLFPFYLTAQNSDSLVRCYTNYMTKINRSKFSPAPLRTINTDSTGMFNYYIIPVVVHVIHKSGEENISDKLILRQIDVLNEDYGHYGKYNEDKRGADSRIRFCLAKRDPDGNPSTGINRIYSDYTDLLAGDEMLTKNQSIWDPKRYLNIWIVKTINGSSSIQAYSYLPRNSGGPKYAGDGIVVVYKYFGRGGNFAPQYDLGRTTTHETGHYFDLLHIWGGDDPGEGGCDDDDGIDDTPVCSMEYYSQPPVCQHPLQCGNVRMVENFLDYSLDGCMELFTPGQANKMIGAILQWRSQMVSYKNVIDCGCRDLYDSMNSRTDVDIYPTLNNGQKLYLETDNLKELPLTVYIYDMYGRLCYSEVYPKISKSVIEINLTANNGHYKPGVYIVTGTYVIGFRKKIVITGN